MIKISEPFAMKFISQQLKPMHKNIISVSFNWLIDSRYRDYMKLNEWLRKQSVPSTFYTNGMINIPFSHWDNFDKLIVSILKYVNKEIRYQTDRNNFGYVERWEDLDITIKRGKGDCENQNALIYVMARLAGIPSYLLWNVIGQTSEGHYWLLYFSPKKAKFYSIDSTYKPNKSDLQYRQPFKIGSDYKKVWYIFNENHVFKFR